MYLACFSRLHSHSTEQAGRTMIDNHNAVVAGASAPPAAAAPALAAYQVMRFMTLILILGLLTGCLPIPHTAERSLGRSA